MKSTVTSTVIFDNGGGITLQLRAGQGEVHHTFAHSYNSAEQAAQDLHAAYHDDPANWGGWEGHEDFSERLDPTEDELRNGAYRVASYTSWEEVVEGTADEARWANMREWDAAIRKLALNMHA